MSTGAGSCDALFFATVCVVALLMVLAINVVLIPDARPQAGHAAKAYCICEPGVNCQQECADIN